MEVKSFARSFTEQAIQTLAGVSKDGANESARVAAAVALLDRGWGKCAQPHTGVDGESGLEITIRNIIEGKT